MQTIQYTIRNIPAAVDKVLRAQAKRRGKSFNQVLVETLQLGSGVGNTPTVYRDLDWFVGSGGIGSKEKAAFKDQRVVDDKLWR